MFISRLVYILSGLLWTINHFTFIFRSLVLRDLYLSSMWSGNLKFHFLELNNNGYYYIEDSKPKWVNPMLYIIGVNSLWLRGLLMFSWSCFKLIDFVFASFDMIKITIEGLSQLTSITFDMKLIYYGLQISNYIGPYLFIPLKWYKILIIKSLDIFT